MKLSTVNSQSGCFDGSFNCLCFLGLAYCLGSISNGPRHESADAFSDLFCRLHHEIMRGVVQVSSDTVRETLPRTTSFAPVALLSHIGLNSSLVDPYF